MTKELHGYELRYLPFEKQAFALVRVVGHFKPYILNTPVEAYVPHPHVKMMLSQPIIEGRWVNWLAKLHEFDIEVRPLKVVIGKGFCKLISGIDVVNLSSQAKISIQDYQGDWYEDLVTYIQSG